MTKLYTYETTHEREDSEGNVISSLEVRFIYTFRPGVPAQISGPPEGCYPAEGPEIEIDKIEIEMWHYGHGKNAVYTWTPVYIRDLYDQLHDWAIDSLWDELVAEAIEEEASAEEAAAELAYETRRELQAMGDEGPKGTGR
jgi:hypothetical protein